MDMYPELTPEERGNRLRVAERRIYDQLAASGLLGRTIYEVRPVPEPPTGHLNGCPADSRQPSPRGSLLAYRLSNSARHGHCGPPPAPFIGIEPGPSRSHAPHSLFQRQGRIASVDSG